MSVEEPKTPTRRRSLTLFIYDFQFSDLVRDYLGVFPKANKTPKNDYEPANFEKLFHALFVLYHINMHVVGYYYYLFFLSCFEAK